jgi:hypothetical protein
VEFDPFSYLCPDCIPIKLDKHRHDPVEIKAPPQPVLIKTCLNTMYVKPISASRAPLERIALL